MDAEDIILICVTLFTVLGGFAARTQRKQKAAQIRRMRRDAAEAEREEWQPLGAALRQGQPEEGVSAVHGKDVKKPVAAPAQAPAASKEDSEPARKKGKIDPKLLVLYSEIMKPKFDEGLE